MSTSLTGCHVVRAAGRWRGVAGLCGSCQQRLYTKDIVKENDVVLLKEKSRLMRKGSYSRDPILTFPLHKRGRLIETGKGNIEETSLIGKGIRDVITTVKGVEFRIHRPTLGEYVRFTPRILTPIYPQDANLIVSLLDLHPTTEPQGANDQPLEIFEAGTGHGSLTLHLARAIHGANPPAPQIPPSKVKKVKPLHNSDPSLGLSTEAPELPSPVLESLVEDTILEDERQQAITATYEAYLPTRRAVIQTLDIVPRHTSHAKNIVRNFKHGLYFPDIDFHTGTIPEYLSSRLAEHASPFLAHAILDLPNLHHHFEIVSRALKPDGLLLVFCPSITQIMQCVQTVKTEFLPLIAESILEIGAGAGTGGREWDIRLVKPRSVLKVEAASMDSGLDSEESETSIADSAGQEVDIPQVVEPSDSGWEMICRPKMLSKFAGGGFIGMFRRMKRH